MIVEMVEEGKRSPEIARALGRSVRAVRARAEKMGVRLRAGRPKRECATDRALPRPKKRVAVEPNTRPYDPGCMPDPLAWYYGRPKWSDAVSKANR